MPIYLKKGEQLKAQVNSQPSVAQFNLNRVIEFGILPLKRLLFW